MPIASRLISPASRVPRAARIAAIVCAAASALAACASLPGAAGGPAVDAPVYRVGDRWEYHIRDGFRVPIEWDETHEVIAIDASGIRVRVVAKGETVNGTREEEWIAPGLVRTGTLFDIETRHFKTPLKRYDFPLVPGKTWSQWIDQHNDALDRDRQINHYVKVGGWSKVTAPAGSFDAIELDIFMTLDDDEVWRYPTQCSYVAWYAPEVRGIVREEKKADYMERGGIDTAGRIRSQNATVTLTRFTPGRE